MEYIDGQDLAELMRRGPLALEFAAEVASAVAQTLENAHKLSVEIEGKEFHGIVHGDIKPKNIRIDARGDVRVLDFGIAKALSLSRRLTRNEFGSVPYASPERLDLGEVNVDSDLWSLAVMLYEMVTGLQPYQAETTERLERMIRSRIPPPPAPDPCPEPLRRILIKAMAPDPELRYPSARELVDDLGRSGGAAGERRPDDLDATRRTTRRENGADDETRRTAPREEAPDEETRRTARASAPAKAPPKRLRCSARLAACLLFCCWPACCTRSGQVFPATSFISTARRWGGRLRPNRLPTPTRSGTDGRNFPGPILRLSFCAARESGEAEVVAAADHVIDTYRNSDSGLRKGMERARHVIACAVDGSR